MKVYSTTVYYGRGRRDPIFAESQDELAEKIEHRRDMSLVALQVLFFFTVIAVTAWMIVLRSLLDVPSFITEASAAMLVASILPPFVTECLHALRLTQALTRHLSHLSAQTVTFMRPIWHDKEWDQ